MGHPLKTRHFQTQLGQVVFKLKKKKVPVDQLSKSKRGLFWKRAIFYLACVKVGRGVKIVWKSLLKTAFTLKMADFCPFLSAKSWSLYLLYPLTNQLKLTIQPSSLKSVKVEVVTRGSQNSMFYQPECAEFGYRWDVMTAFWYFSNIYQTCLNSSHGSTKSTSMSLRTV